SEYYTRFINDDTVFIHYTGITKPWHDWANYASADYFRNIYNLSPWRNIPYKKAVKKHEYKEKYKHLLYQKKFLDGVFTAIKYNVMKG
ncbi:TPA: glycosyltransferase family 8 protein, partial [Escherichia coli]|nr:glycosyltransferase family 8 protein [Escherichia coli]